MGKIIDRVRLREQSAEAKREFDASPFGRILAHDAANPGKTIKFRRWVPPSFGAGAAEPVRPDPECPDCKGSAPHCGGSLCQFGKKP